ncbi:transposase family protein [bacterium]|nr:transposase family protein [bacterium]
MRAEYPDHVWTYDFMEDATAEGRKLRVLTLVDEYTRECPVIEVDRRMKAKDVIRVLERVMVGRRPSTCAATTARVHRQGALDLAVERGVETHHIDPGSPWQNPFGEKLNGRLRDECLNLELFQNLLEAKVVVEEWRRDYNLARPHSSPGLPHPAQFRAAWQERNGPAPDPGVYAFRPPGEGNKRKAGMDVPCPSHTGAGRGAQVALQRALSSGPARELYHAGDEVDNSALVAGIITRRTNIPRGKQNGGLDRAARSSRGCWRACAPEVL